MNSLDKLTELFRRFPGIGPRQAKRFTHHVAHMTPSQRTVLAETIVSLSKNVSLCTECFRLTEQVSGSKCSFCGDDTRDSHTLMLVEKDTDATSVEYSKAYRGNYFILGGTVPVLDENPMSRFRSEELKRKLHKDKNTLTEVVIALSATPQGEHTTDILREFIQKHSPTLTVSVLGRGLSTGSELEYLDSETLTFALKNRS